MEGPTNGRVKIEHHEDLGCHGSGNDWIKEEVEDFQQNHEDPKVIFPSYDSHEIYTCYHCGACYQYLELLRSHIKSAHLLPMEPKGRYLCPNCTFSSDDFLKLENHMLDELQRKCPVCDFIPENAEAMEKHKRLHNGSERLFTCPTFELTSLPGEGKIGRKKKLSPKDKPYRCDLCDYSGRHMCNLRTHMMQKHTSDRPFVCKLCPYKTAYKPSLKSHIKARHHKIRDHPCPYCDLSLTRRHVLMDHIAAVHFKERPFACKLCSYSAPVSSYLRAHVRSRHSDVKPYKCPFCTYSSVRSNTLRGHIRSRHTFDKPHKCTQCDYTSLRPSFLREHILSKHTTERPCVCPHCNFSTVRQANLRSHIQKHLKEANRQKERMKQMTVEEFKDLVEKVVANTAKPVNKQVDESESDSNVSQGPAGVVIKTEVESEEVPKKIIWKQDSTTQTPSPGVQLPYSLLMGALDNTPPSPLSD